MLTLAGKEWIKAMLFGTALFPIFISGTTFIVNIVAFSYHASRALSLFTMVNVAITCCTVTVTLAKFLRANNLS